FLGREEPWQGRRSWPIQLRAAATAIKLTRSIDVQEAPPVKVIGFDHMVLTVASIERTVAFYTHALGMTHEVFGPDRRSALRFGAHKINLHQADNMFSPRAERPMPGSGDICL